MQKELLGEMQALDLEEAKEYHTNLKESLKSPTDEYLEIQAELDDLNVLETEQQAAVAEIGSQSVGSGFNDKISYLFENPETALNRADKMMEADSLSEEASLADKNAGQDFYQSVEQFGGQKNEAFREKDMESIILETPESLGEADMLGGQDLVGGDNDLRKSAKRDVARGSISQETVELQANAEVGLDEDALLRKAELEEKRDTLLAENGSDIAADITRQRTELGLEPMAINLPESLSLAVQDMQTELEKRQEKSAEMDIAHDMSMQS